MTIPPGRLVHVLLRSEMEEGMASGCLTRDRAEAQRAGAAHEVETLPKRSTAVRRTKKAFVREDPHTSEAIKGLAKALGMPIPGARAQYVKHAGGMEGSSPEAVCRAVRATFNCLSLEERLADLAELTGDAPEELETAVEHHSQRLDRTAAQVIDWLTFAHEVDSEEEGCSHSDVLDKLHALRKRGRVTEDDARRLVREELLAGPVREAAEAGNRIVVNSTVRVLDVEHMLYAQTGKVLKLMANDKLQVSFVLDPEMKRYRILALGQVVLAGEGA